MKRWNILTAAALAVGVAGFLLAKSGSLFGCVLLTAGCLAFVVSLVGSSRYSAKHPPRCPHCGGAMTYLGRRWPGSRPHLGQTAFCPDCGGTFSPEDLK